MAAVCRVQGSFHKPLIYSTASTEHNVNEPSFFNLYPQSTASVPISTGLLIFQFSVLLRCNGCFHFLVKMFSGKLNFLNSQGNLAIAVCVLPWGFPLRNARHPLFHKITKLSKKQNTPKEFCCTGIKITPCLTNKT